MGHAPKEKAPLNTSRHQLTTLAECVPARQLMPGHSACCMLAPCHRGIKSFGMLLAASNAEHTIVEPLVPPAGAKAGDRIYAGDNKEQVSVCLVNDNMCKTASVCQ